ncbi:MAG: RHS repeat-associated core domain-containing protein [bacterium]
MNKSRCICIFIVFFLFCFVFFSQPAFAKPIGADAPCQDCCQQTLPDIPSCSGPCTDVSGGSFISYSHGTMGDSYPVISAQGESKAGLDLALYYASYIADGEKASLNTVMGFGWSHSYNIFLFQQGRDIFKISPGGLVTQYKRTGRTGPLKATRGHQQTIIENSDGSIEIRNNDGLTYLFEKITGNPLRILGNAPWLLSSITDRNGNTTELIYQNGLLRNVKDEYGRQIGFEYDVRNRIIKITDPGNRITEMAYDSYDNLSNIKDPFGQTTAYTYNERHQIVGKTDKNGNQWQYEYDATGHPIGIRDGNGNRLFSLNNSSGWETGTYDLFRTKQRTYIPSITTRTDGRGNQWQYHYNEDGFITKIIAPDGTATIYTYDPVTLNIETETDCKGNTTSYKYDSKGNRTKAIDTLGNETAYTNDPTYSLVTSITDPDGDVTTYEYDASGNLIKETNPLGNVTIYIYDSHGNILCKTDCNGNTICYGYDIYGNRIKEIDPLGCEIHYTYDVIGNMLSRTDANGHTATYEYDLLDRLMKETDSKGCIITYTYDGKGNRLTITDDKGTTAYEYDLRDRLVKVTDVKGGINVYAHDENGNKISETNALGFTTTYEYDLQNRLIKTTDAKNCITTITYDCAGNRISGTDAYGNVTTYEYDPLNRLIKTTDPLGNTTTYTYNGAGGGGCSSCCGPPTAGSSLIASITDANGKVTCYKYDKLDRQIKVIQKVGDTDCSIIDADDAVTEYTYDCMGNRLTVTDENNNTTTYTYNAGYELVQECNPENECTQYTYDCVGNKLTETRPNGNVITYAYDEKDQLTAITDSIGKVASYTYDCVGNRIIKEDGNNNKTKYGYDELNRLIKVTDPMNEFTTYEYDAVGNLIKITDREGNPTLYTYDEVNRRLTVTDALNGVTSYEYDCMGNLIKITDCNNNSTTYEYDSLNRLIKETYADGGTKELTYDGVENLITRKDQNGIITSYQYDELYNLVKRDYPGANDDTFSYDMGGRMLTADNLYSTITFAYDGANRVTQTTLNSLAVNYAYDIANNKRIITYPGGKVVKEEMDKRYRLKRIKDAIDQIVAENTYDLGDRITERAFLNTTGSGWNYNQNNWITQLTHGKGTFTLIDFEYTYDKEGNRLYSRKNHDTSNSEKYTYDGLYRLTEFKRGTMVSEDIPSPGKQCFWTLDCVGNWLKGPLPCPQPGGCPITNNEVNEYTNLCGVGRTHDNNGNLTDDAINTYEYDYENRLIKVTRKSDRAILGEYRYDALSRRFEKEVSGVVTSFVYDDTRVIEERQDESVMAEYIYGSRIDEVLTMDQAGFIYYYHTNALGSIVALTDSAGNIVEHYRYDAYGTPEIFVNPGGDGIWLTSDDVSAAYSGVGNPYLFTGRRLDGETGLYYYRARYYDCRKGRFLKRDPLGFADGMNLYEYTKGRPTTLLDAFGFLSDWGVASAIFAHWSAANDNDPFIREGGEWGEWARSKPQIRESIRTMMRNFAIKKCTELKKRKTSESGNYSDEEKGVNLGFEITGTKEGAIKKWAMLYTLNTLHKVTTMGDYKGIYKSPSDIKVLMIPKQHELIDKMDSRGAKDFLLTGASWFGKGVGGMGYVIGQIVTFGMDDGESLRAPFQWFDFRLKFKSDAILYDCCSLFDGTVGEWPETD